MANQSKLYSIDKWFFCYSCAGRFGWTYADGQFAVTVAVAWKSNGLANLTKALAASKTQAQCSRRNSIESIQSSRVQLNTNFRSVSRAMFRVVKWSCVKTDSIHVLLIQLKKCLWQNDVLSPPFLQRILLTKNRKRRLKRVSSFPFMILFEVLQVEII